MIDTTRPAPAAAPSAPPSSHAETLVGGRQPPIKSPGDVATRMMDFIPDGPSTAAPNLSGMPEQLGPYRLIKPLGRGGMGAVYLAEDTQLRRQTALKVMLPEFAADTHARERFLREARAVAAIRNDFVVTVYQVGEESGMPFIAMELLRGAPLDGYLAKEAAPSMTAILRLAREIATGLAAAHEKGLVHRDIKPANIWLEAPKGRVKILDFGLARPTQPEREDVERLTHDGMVMGTPAYMSPEQARGHAVDFRTDLFSLGVVLYRLCTGQLPFSGPTTTAVLTQLAIYTPPSAADVNPQVPAALSNLINRLLEKEPTDRPQSARDVANSLRQIDVTATRHVALAIVAPPVDDDVTEEVSQPVRPRRRRRRRKKVSTDWLIGIGATVALIAMAVGVPLVLYKLIESRKTDTKPVEPAATSTPTKSAPMPTLAQSSSRTTEAPMPMPVKRPDPSPDRLPPPPEPPRRPGEGPPPGFPPRPPPPGAPGGPPLGPRPGP